MYTDPNSDRRDDGIERTAGPGTDERVLTTTKDHDVIRQWAEDRHAAPATTPSTDEDVRLGSLRFDLDFGQDLEELTPVEWDEWFTAFDERGLTFAYEAELRPDGSPSNFFHVEAPGERR